MPALVPKWISVLSFCTLCSLKAHGGPWLLPSVLTCDLSSVSFYCQLPLASIAAGVLCGAVTCVPSCLHLGTLRPEEGPGEVAPAAVWAAALPVSVTCPGSGSRTSGSGVSFTEAQWSLVCSLGERGHLRSNLKRKSGNGRWDFSAGTGRGGRGEAALGGNSVSLSSWAQAGPAWEHPCSSHVLVPPSRFCPALNSWGLDSDPG